MFVKEEFRRVIPRWRTAALTSATGELAPLLVRGLTTPPSQDFLSPKVEEWRTHRSVGYAADVVGAAVVLGQETMARDAAAFLLAHATDVSAPVYSLALRVLGQDRPTPSLREAIHRLRRQVQEEPRSALTWVDLSRWYAVAGLPEKATHAMRAAVQLAPHHRFVLRSAARLQLHRGDPEQAHDLLRRNPATRADPWLLAAEIAIAGVANRTSTLLKRARDLVESSRFAPLQVAELATALATVELGAGDRKRARRLFQRALRAPTENALAQATWTARLVGGIEVDTRLLEAPRCFEARALEHFWEGRWQESLTETGHWLEDEPFSVRPVIHGSFVAAVLLEDYRLSVDIIAKGRHANPSDPRLINNQVFALASDDQVQDAQKLHAGLHPASLDSDMHITWLATSGLLQFRLGLPNEGRRLYLDAIQEAAGESHHHQRAMAAIFLAREEILSETGQASLALARARQEAKGLRLPHLGTLLERIERLQAQQAAGPAS